MMRYSLTLIRVCFLTVFLAAAGSCMTRTKPEDLQLPGASPDLAQVYIYMPKDVDIPGSSRENEILYANGAEVGSIRPGYSLGFLAPPGFITIATKGSFQEKLERMYYVDPGERLFVAMEKGLNLRGSGFIFYEKPEAEGLKGIGATRFSVVRKQEIEQ
ncbi:MAG: hypothetical protein JXB03_10580 [Spirochaetales bacterium]|nr:hypothetical protein [Spirochaetales bacterium]